MRGSSPTAAQTALDAIWRENLTYKKAGVMLLNLTPSSLVQGDLWTGPDDARSKTLMRTIDRINAHHGRDAVSLAASGRKRPWCLRSGRRSPRYTTVWRELLTVA
jgi:DNA polymerase V